MRHNLMVLAPAMFLLAACGAERAHDATGNEAENSLNQAAGNEAGAVVPAAADFVVAIASSDLYEIQSGELAADKASSPEVKSFAQMLVADHRKSTADLKAAAAGVNPPVSVDPVLDQEKLTMIDELQKAPAGQFDQAFIDQQKTAHRKTLDVLSQYQSSGDSQPLKDFAAKAATVVQAHLDKLEGMKP